jgi:hypothetical protein
MAIIQNREQIFKNTFRDVSGVVSVLKTDYTLKVDTTSSTCDITLLEIPVNFDRGYKLYVLDNVGNAATNNITVIAPAGHLINGESQIVINKNYGSLIIRYVEQGHYSAFGVLDASTSTDDTTIYDRDGSLTGERRLTFNGFNLGFIGTEKFGVGVEPNAIGISTDTEGIDDTSVQFHVAGAIRTDNWYHGKYGLLLHQKDSTSNNGRLNVYCGVDSGLNATAVNSTAFGYSALKNDTGGANVGIGYKALEAQTTGFSNTAIGWEAMSSGIGGNENTAIGKSTLKNVTGSQNTAIGENAGRELLAGSNNTLIGGQALENGTACQSVVAIGNNALQDATGSYNTVIGTGAAQNFTDVNYLTFLGELSGGTAARTGLYELVLIGSKLSSSWNVNSDSLVKSISIMNDIDNSNQIRIGNITDHTSAEIPVTWTVTSDERFKNILQENVPGLDFITQLNPIKYKLKDIETGEDKENKPRYGFSAQQVLSVEGENVVIGDDSDQEHLKLRESMIVPILVNAIKELNQQIINLKTNNNLV